MKIVIIGIQGSGKSTQGNSLSKEFSIPYLSTGHIFRDVSHEKTSFGRYIKEVVNAGVLAPDDITLEIVSSYLQRTEYQKGYVLDGFPRTLAQAKSFRNGIDKVVYLKVSDKEALWRLSYRKDERYDIREDETLKAIRRRIEQFHKHTQPVIEYYRQKGLLIEVDGEQSIEEIHKEIMRKIGR